jgi:hypothetical protein
MLLHSLHVLVSFALGSAGASDGIPQILQWTKPPIRGPSSSPCLEGVKHRPSLKLKYRLDSVGGLDVFTDSDCGNSVSWQSTTGLVARYNRAPILWRSKMQKTVALSSAEAEFYSASEMAVEVIYLSNLLGNMRQGEIDHTHLYEDNTACIEWSNHVMGECEQAKHIDIHKHLLMRQ